MAPRWEIRRLRHRAAAPHSARLRCSGRSQVVPVAAVRTMRRCLAADRLPPSNPSGRPNRVGLSCRSRNGTAGAVPTGIVPTIFVALPNDQTLRRVIRSSHGRKRPCTQTIATKSIFNKNDFICTACFIATYHPNRTPIRLQAALGSPYMHGASEKIDPNQGAFHCLRVQ